jgi:WD40 repeat protein
VSFAADGQRLASSSEDGSMRIWSVETGEELARLIALDHSDWAVTLPDGRFDASPEGMKLMHWIVGSEAIAFEQLKHRYFEPGLLAKIMGFNPERLGPMSADQKIELFPLVEVEPPGSDSAKLIINLTNQGGGIGQVQVWVNDKEVTLDARPRNFDPRTERATLTVDLANSSYFLGRNNEIRVQALNAEGYLSSRAAKTEWLPQGNIDARPPELYAIVAGISNYTSPDLDLRFAAKDADAMSKAITLGAKRLFGADKVHLTLLSSSSDPRAVAPTKANFKKAFADATNARPADILVVYFAGHGITRENSDTYYYLTKEARTKDSSVLSDSGIRERTTVSSEELAEWTRRIPALKQVMILDTCAAGAAAEKLVEQRSLPRDQIRAIERLKDRTGFHILMGSAADAVSYEATSYGQGLVTYSLLQGMSGAALRDEEYVDVQTLFQYTVNKVPELAEGLGSIQRPLIAARKGTSFDIGKLIKEDRAGIPLATSKTVILRPLLLEVPVGDDTLYLNRELRKRLREESYISTFDGQKGLGIVYFDVDEFKNGIRPSGTYKVEGERVVLSLNLRQDDRTLASVTIEGSKTDIAALVNKIVETIIQRTRKL